MYKPPNLPDWLTQVMKELTRPPYFLEHLHREQTSTAKSQQSATWTTEPADDNAPGKREHGAAIPSSKAPAEAAKRPSQALEPRDEVKAKSQSQEFVATAMPASGRAGDVRIPAGAWQSVFRKANIPTSVAKAYGWTIKRCIPVANAVKVETKSGTFALKQTHLSAKRVEFLDKLFAYLKDQGYAQHPSFVRTRPNRHPYVVRKSQTFYATEWIAGNPANFASPQQTGMVAQTLARFHELSRGYESGGYSPAMEYGLATMYRRRTEDLRALLVRAEARNPTDPFDQLLLKLGNQLRADAEASLRLLEEDPYQQFLARDEEFPGLCHLDVIPENFIYNDRREMVAIDYDLATYAPRVLDMSHLLRRSLQKQNWRSDTAYACFVGYNDVRTIRSEEYRLIYALLRFPYRAWRLAHTRYRVTLDGAQLEELQACADQEQRRQNFLSEYERQIARVTH